MSTSTKTPPSLEELRARREEILALGERYGAHNVRVFGSVARGEADPESDIDLLVDFDAHTMTQRVMLIQELADLLDYPVEVASAEHLRQEMRVAILRDAKPLLED